MNEPAEFVFNLPDENDRASAIEMAVTQASVEDIQRRVKQDQEPDADGVYRILDCVDCGEEIGTGRLRASIRNTLCIFCASALERRK